ncbi:TraB/GumN family protein [Shouchella sp. 1P09AA]|uniref:TraB/GumN family protein n=1 Tax=unclassified Shouchella TaxID=2893065 RepID=UPI0039A1E4F9
MNCDIRSFQQVRTAFEMINGQRNLCMCKKLEQTRLSRRALTYFVFVGAFHVLLEPSLPTLLKNKGYPVERIL